MYHSLPRLLSIVLLFSFLPSSCSIPIKAPYSVPVKAFSVEDQAIRPPKLDAERDERLALSNASLLRYAKNTAQTLVSQSGNTVSFYKIHGTWKAQVQYSFGRVDEALLPVLCASHRSPAVLLSALGKQAPVIHKYRIHEVHVPQGKAIFLGTLGLLGGMEQEEKQGNILSLQEAIRVGNLEAVQQLLESGVDPNITHASDCIPLLYAAETGHLELIKLLLKNRANPNITDTAGRTPLYIAAAQGYQEIVHYLLKKRADPNITNGFNNTPLHVAADKGCIEAVHYLLAYGTDPNIADRTNNVALHIAADNGNLAIVKLLLDHTCNPSYINQAGQYGNTPLHWAVHKGLVEVAAELLQRGADPNVGDAQKNSPLHIALQAQNGQKELVQLLLNNHADPNKRNNTDVSPFHLAVEYGDLSTVQLLLKKGADPNITDINGDASLHIAAEEGHLGIIKLLLDTKAQINIQNAKGDTFLHILACRKDLDLLLATIEYLPRLHREYLHRLQGELTDYCSIQTLLSIIVDYAQGMDCSLRNRQGKTIKDLIEAHHSANNLQFNKVMRILNRQERPGGWYQADTVLGARPSPVEQTSVELDPAEATQELATKKARHHY